MPTTVQCPTCGVDGTEAANSYLSQIAPAAPDSAPTPSLLAARRSPQPPPAKKKRAHGEPNLMLGSIGAVGGAFVAMLVWFFIIKLTNYEIGIIAWGVGIVVGVGCRTLGGGYSQLLGVIAGACALVAIVGGEYLATKSAFDEFVGGFGGQAYEAQMDYAKQVVAADKDDSELRRIIAENQSEEDEDESVKPADISDADLQKFRREELPKMVAFVGGTPTQEQFERDFRREMNSTKMKAFILKESVSLWTLLWLFLGVGSAYRLGTGETE
jgi:hypothetical protein